MINVNNSILSKNLIKLEKTMKKHALMLISFLVVFAFSLVNRELFMSMFGTSKPPSSAGESDKSFSYANKKRFSIMKVRLPVAPRL